MQTKIRLILTASAMSAAAGTYAIKAVVGTGAAAWALLIVTFIAWWIAWKSVETLIPLGMGVVLYLTCSGEKMPSSLPTVVLLGLSVAAGTLCWAPAILTKVKQDED